MKFTIIQDLLPKFESKMDSLIRKFSKYGHGSYIYNKGIPYICEDKDSPKYGVKLIDIDVTTEYKLGDYKFIASLEWIEDANENLIKKASENIFVPSLYKTRRECDHCKTKRKRKSTVLLYSEKENKYIQVGKSCVKDYIGIDIGNYASYLSFFDNLEEYMLECEKDTTSYKKDYEVDEVLKLTLEDVKRYGYISKQKAIDNDVDSTAYKVFMMITDGKDYYTGDKPYIKYDNLSIGDNQIKEVKEFFLALPEDNSNDYINNIKTILQSKWVNVNNIALVVSSIGTKIRIENENEEKKESTSQYVGKVGDKITFKSKVECLYSTMSSYGMFRIYKMYQDENEVIWKTTKYLDTDIEYEFTATIKGHEEYKGIKQTEITRAKVKIINKNEIDS